MSKRDLIPVDDLWSGAGKAVAWQIAAIAYTLFLSVPLLFVERYIGSGWAIVALPGLVIGLGLVWALIMRVTS